MRVAVILLQLMVLVRAEISMAGISASISVISTTTHLKVIANLVAATLMKLGIILVIIRASIRVFTRRKGKPALLPGHPIETRITNA